MNNFCIRRYTLAALLVGAGAEPGCNLVFEQSKSTSTDARISADGTITTDGKFLPGPVFRNAEDTGLQGGDPTFGADQNEIWYVLPGTPSNLQQATRVKEATAFINLAPQAGLNSTFNEFDPAFTADGTLIAFASNRDAINKVYFARRPASGAVFEPPAASNVTLSSSFVGFDISKDGLKLYVIDSANLLVYDRSAPGDKFNLPTLSISLPTSAPGNPSVSSDEKEILFNQPAGSGRIFHARLSADGKSYENPTALVVGEPCNNVFEDADLSADAMTVVYNCDGFIHIARRL